MDADVAWAAGFYEGEGSIVCAGRRALMLTIGQREREPLEMFQRVFGVGSINPVLGRVFHVYRVHAAEAQSVAMRVWPMLSQRRQDQVLKPLLAYAFRRVRDPNRCQRGHVYADVGVYIAPDGGRECSPCRAQRRCGAPTAASRRFHLAIELGIGVREYVPPTIKTARGAVACTFGMSSRDYRPSVQT